MIGRGGSCARADHGIGITETNEASFIELDLKEFDSRQPRKPMLIKPKIR